LLASIALIAVLGIVLVLAAFAWSIHKSIAGRMETASVVNAPPAVVSKQTAITSGPLKPNRHSPPTTTIILPPNSHSAYPAMPTTKPAPPWHSASLSVVVHVKAPAATEPIAHAETTSRPRFHPIRPGGPPRGDLDDAIGQSISRGVSYLLAQFTHGHLRQYNGNGQTAGMDALAVYALLQAGEATHDLRLGPNTPLVDEMLQSLKAMPMDQEDTVYSRSLRSAALSVYARQTDKPALRADASWLMHAGVNGGFTYEPITPQPGPRGKPDLRWDNSNSQYGALGVWAASEAGVEVSSSFWEQIQRHWVTCQLPDGEWGYAPFTDTGRLSMTVAGITTLFVTEDQLDVRKIVTTLGHAPFTPALTRGLNWLEAGDNSVDLPDGQWRSYNLFGLERAALASGFKYFGTHDWYRELAHSQLPNQQSDGSWVNTDPVVDTSYTLLFLSRGRHPIFMNKVRFDGFWANRPRDISNLCHYTAEKLERPINWQVVSFKSDWTDWMDSPILYLASHEPVKLSDEDYGKLRQFALNGGLIFTHADGDSPDFNRFAADLSKRLFPEYPLTDLPANHPIYSDLYKVNPEPRLQGVSNGSRLLLLHSPTDLNKAWQTRDFAEHPNQFQMGMNIFIYAAGKANLRNKLKTPYVPEPDVKPVLTTTIAQLQYLGNWNPEPAALPRFARLFVTQTGVRIEPRPIDPAELDPITMPFAHLTGTDEVHFTSAQLLKMHDYVNAGGTLLIDACGGSSAFTKSMLVDVLPHAFPQNTLSTMKSDHPIIAGSGDGMTPLTLRLRPYQSETTGSTTAPVQFFNLGKGIVIFSPVDVTTALLGTNTWPINGYEPDAAFDLLNNIFLFALEKPQT
jgi:hypothetical protein